MHGIRFDPPCIVFPNTYISSTSRIALKILNESEEVHHISFRNFSTIQEEISILNQQDLLNPEHRTELGSLFEYSSEIFTIEPHELDIWPNSFQQIFVTFSPQVAARNSSFAYVQIDEFTDRYKLQIVANALPPVAQFLTTQVIVGNVFLDSIFEYQVVLKNVGDVPVHFCYEPHDTGNLLFEFNPSEGEIAVNNQVPIVIKFTASTVKLFNETFVFKIRGAINNHPSIVMCGKVIGPTFTINPKKIDFGGVGYGFLYTKTIEIENNSEIPFDFVLRMSHDGSFERREFQLKPEFGTISKYSKQKVEIEFIPISIQSYSLSILFDITRFGTNLAEIPITANCVCPKLELIPSSFDLKDAFIGYKYEHEIAIRNESLYPAKYEIAPQEMMSLKHGIIDTDKWTGLIAPNGDTPVNLQFTTQSIGNVSVDCFFRIYGSDDPPMKFTFNANSIGPQISLSPNSISFGTIPVLVEKTTELKVTNNSLIKANFRCIIESSTGGFDVSPKEGSIEPNSSIMLSVSVFMNDIIAFSGSLKLCFDYLNPIAIPLKAQGSGSPVISSIDMKCIDFGYALTEQTAIKKFEMENKSNRPFEIRFTPNKVQTPKNQKSDFVFNIEPEHVIIPGRSTQSYSIFLYCSTVVPFTMPLQCHATIGRQRIMLYDSVLKGSFVRPLMTLSTTSLEFQLQCLPCGEPRSQILPSKELLTITTQKLTLTNKSKITLPIEVECPDPFLIDFDKFNIEPDNSKELVVSFDPSFKSNFVTEVIQKTIIFSFVGHPQKIKVNAKGTIVFPNLKLTGDCFEPSENEDQNSLHQKIDFGVLMMNTERTKSINMTNNADIAVEYEWQLLSTNLNTNKVFDIFPLYGTIKPNESIPTHFSFFALADLAGNVRDYNANAVCHVAGGPDYVISLSGSSATIMYKIQPVSFSYSSICYSSSVTGSLTISNSSKTAISFNVKIPKNIGFQSLVVTPKKGIISTNDMVSLSMSITPGLPKLFKESFYIQIGDFEDVKIDVILEACFSQVMVSLPRSENDASYLALKGKIDSKQAKLALPKSDTSRNGLSLLVGPAPVQVPQKEKYKFTDEELLEEEKKVILSQMRPKHSKRVQGNKPTSGGMVAGMPSFRGLAGMPSFSGIAGMPSYARLAGMQSCLSFRGSQINLINYVATYEIQFGEMIISEQIKKTFTVKSIAPFPITFEMDLNNLKKTGLKIEPSIVKDLMPGNEVEIDVTFVPVNRKLTELGHVCYEIPVTFGDNHMILLFIKATMERPSLNFSCKRFDFGHVIIGQTKVMTIQLQNMSNASCEFHVGQFETINKNDLRRSSSLFVEKAEKECEEEVNEAKNQQSSNRSPFVTIPDCGILPPSSFMNVAIHFSPHDEKSFHMRFPVNISFNRDPFYVNVSGSGDSLKLIFEPKELTLPTIQPFSQQSTANVIVKNPNPYPIEFFSLQFDQQLIVEEAADPRQAESPFVTYTPKAKNPASASKFALCIIINGPPFSGKTSIAKELSANLKLPVLNLRDIWSETTDYLSRLYAKLISSEYNQGLIVDGLDSFDDTGENEMFLQSVFKMNKNASEDILKNSFASFAHQNQSIYEKVFDIILGALNGHFVFHIAIKLPVEEIMARKTLKIQEEEGSKLKSLEEEKEKLFSMSEEEYLKLSEDERLDIDNKRKFLRDEILSSIEKMADDDNHEKKRRLDDSKQSSRVFNNQGKKKVKSSQIPNDPTQVMSVAFQYSVGNIVQKAQNPTDRFKAIDPYEMESKVQPEPAGNPLLNSGICFIDQNKKVFNLYNCEYSMNSLLVDGNKSIEEITNDILDYLPPITTLKEVAFKMQIPEPIIKDDTTNDSLKMVSRVPQFFSISNEESQIAPGATASKNNGSNKKANKDQSSRIDHSQILDELDENVLKNLTNRWKLPPNGETNLTIRFESNTVGNLSDALLFSIAKCQIQPAKLKVKGISQYPEIERNKKLIFEKLIKKFDSKNCPAYVVNQNEFDFGFCISCKEKPSKNQAQYKTVVKLTNISEFPAECQAVFVSQTGNNKGAWFIDQTNFTIKPANLVSLTVGFHPMTSELFKTTLAVFIKDNPEPLYLNFSGDSSIPTIESSQQNVDFEKILIGNEKSKKIDLKNPGKLPAYWKLKGAQQFSPNISFSLQEGELGPSKSCSIIAKFSSQKPVQIKKPITIEVYDIEKSRMFSSFNINVSVESFDVNFDVIFPKGQQDQFDFGNLKVEQSKAISISLRNRGKFPVDYKFTYINKEVSKYLKISSKEGSVKNGDKTVQITFTFCSNTVVKFDSTKCVSLTVIDTQTKSTTAQLSYTITAATFFSTFTIDSEKSLQFGNVQANTNYHKEIVIANTGPFPFEFDFHSKSRLEDNGDGANGDEAIDSASSSSIMALKKKGQQQQFQAMPNKQKQKKSMQNSAQISAYLIYPATGTINSGASVTVSVDLNSPEGGKFNTAMILSISEANPSEKTTVFKLSSEVFVPGINISDKERLFPRLPLCIRFDMAKSDLTSFLEDENILHFAPLIANKKQSVNVRLINQQPIPIDVDLIAKSKGKAMPFELSDKSVHINGNDFANVVITFSPSSSDNYQASFEANVRNGTNPATKSLKFGLEGTGTIPTISLKTQLDKGKGNSYVVNMGKTLVGYDKQKVISIGNDSQVACSILLQIPTKQIVDFIIDGCEINKPVTVDPGRQFLFTVIHKPQKMRKSQVDIVTSCVENNKSSYSFSFIAEGFCEDVVFDGLEGEDNELHFRGAVVGRSQSVSLTMKNLSDATIRFQWVASNEFVFSPRVGHLQELQTKEITITFSSEKPVKFIGSKAACQIAKIELVDPLADDWDDTQKMLTFVPRSEVLPEPVSIPTSRNHSAINSKSKSKNNSSKSNKNSSQSNSEASSSNSSINKISELISVASIKPEPTYNLITSGRPKELNIKLFVISDIIKLSVDTSEIPFAPTMMFQTRTSEFKMSNLSQIRIEYDWTLEKFESLRTDYESTRPCPFTIEPSSGFIEAGQQTTFKAIFAPMEVDDFVATFKCMIPFYNQEPPRLSLTALSRRPICHFNVPLSDYLTRRHPEFTDQLPEDVKVIEIFAKSAKSRSTSKIEIVNPTFELYEARWTLLKDNSNSSINCENVSAIVSSGKRYYFTFSYSPKSAKTVESLYLFEIPAHSIKVHFLIVGRITH